MSCDGEKGIACDFLKRAIAFGKREAVRVIFAKDIVYYWLRRHF
jgi:hypothetical protein